MRIFLYFQIFKPHQYPTLQQVMLFGYTLQVITIVGTLMVTYSIFIYSGTVKNPVECNTQQ